jgi:phosphatidylserine/phosphatidylglycerophosphate/cardiolipin synthase-like enzyme
VERDGSYIGFADSGSYPLRPKNDVRPLVDGEPAFRGICEAVEAARKSIWVTVAFLHGDVQMPDGRGSFFDVLDAARARGLDVRGLFWRSPEQEKDAPGVHFPGTPEQRSGLHDRGSRFLARWDSLPKKLCHHQKSWIIDAGGAGEIAFVGGINLDPGSVVPPGHPPRDIGNVHGNVHDLYVRIRGPAATDVHHNFVQRWNESTERDRDDGAWPSPSQVDDLPFPTSLTAPVGEIPVQISRTVRAGLYTNGAATPGGRPFSIAEGERSALEQYLKAIDAAQRSIYVEDQVIGSPRIVDGLHRALERGVEVVFLVPVQAHKEFVAARRDERLKPYFEKLHALGRFDRFALVGIASNAGPGLYQDVYVHAKIMLVDDVWATIGSTNIADRSFEGDTELNASFWHAETVRALRRELLLEHLAVDTGGLDDRAALRLYREVARKNADRRGRGAPLEGLAFEIAPEEHGL